MRRNNQNNAYGRNPQRQSYDRRSEWDNNDHGSYSRRWDNPVNENGNSSRRRNYDDFYDGSSRNAGGSYGREQREYDNYNEGYAGRNASDYENPHYGGRYYNPDREFGNPSSRYEQNDRGGYRHDDNRGYRQNDRGYRNDYDNDYENNYRNSYGYDRGNYSNRNDDRERYSYGYYESYPSYGQSAPYNDHERGYESRNNRSRGHYPADDFRENRRRSRQYDSLWPTDRRRGERASRH